MNKEEIKNLILTTKEKNGSVNINNINFGIESGIYFLDTGITFECEHHIIASMLYGDVKTIN